MGLMKYLKQILSFKNTPHQIVCHVDFQQSTDRFKGKKVLVTGGSSGIGFEIARQYVSEGAYVLITGRQEETLKQSCEKLGNDKATYIVWDLQEVPQIYTMFKACIKRLKDIDIFVNNAGVFKTGKWDSVDFLTYEYINSINAKALFHLCKAEEDYLVSTGRRGYVINVCSMDGLISNFTPYGVSKWNATAITKEFALSMQEKGVIVNGIAPGAVVTNIAGKTDKDVYQNAYSKRHPTGRYVLTEEIAQLTLLLTDKNNHVRGQIIAVDGGTSIFES